MSTHPVLRYWPLTSTIFVPAAVSRAPTNAILPSATCTSATRSMPCSESMTCAPFRTNDSVAEFMQGAPCCPAMSSLNYSETSLLLHVKVAQRRPLRVRSAMLKEQPSHCPAVTPGGSVLFQEF